MLDALANSWVLHQCATSNRSSAVGIQTDSSADIGNDYGELHSQAVGDGETCTNIQPGGGYYQ